ncbi:VOC family protein [Flavobacterium sp. SUN052]|uniref:VOC family protein n=1 Tax=Flavobacterium sp. SUN052 TaxID=3002441 RepID=UPI00237E619B|nr:VOC family protein [Flavobacterium sp. SUN052]MEC4004372.1 VOC family protein [Flavobacterium sp. SUN052]
MHQFLSGIQQVGIGVKDAEIAMHTFKNIFGMDVLIFDDQAKASLMTQYTGNQEYNRRAILTMNLQGGGGLELWQFLDRTPTSNDLISLGDIGIYAAIIKSTDISKSYNRLKNCSEITLSKMQECSSGINYFFATDSSNNTFKIIPYSNWFQSGKHDLGGVVGAVIGVSNMEKSLHFYQVILGLDEKIYDFEINENGQNLRKVGLHKKATGKGAFNNLLGNVSIELIQNLDKTAPKIYANRFWGDCGFIHLCFDVVAMDKLKSHVENHGLKFSVDSNNTFAMDNASGRFCYIEDPDGTLIELVETHKVPVLKKIGWYLDLRKRNQEKPLPNWMIKMLAFSKVK